MSLPRTYRAVGLTLRKTPMGEADLVATIYTGEHGKLPVRARAARRLASKLMGHLEPLTLVELALTRSRTPDTPDIVTEAQVVHAFPAVKAGYDSTARGLYIAELLDAFCPLASPNPALFNLALQTLHVLNDHANDHAAGSRLDDDARSELPLRYFDLQLLNLSGFLPELYQCVACGDALLPERHRYAAGAGGALCPDCAPPPDVAVRPLPLGALKVLRLLHRTPSAGELPPLSLPPPVLRAVRGILSATLQYWIDRPVQSQVFLDAAQSHETRSHFR